MNLETQKDQSNVIVRKRAGDQIDIPITDYKSLPIPSTNSGTKVGICYVNVLSLPSLLDKYMKVNPRVPSRNAKGVLSGPVVKGILNTLRDSPEEMVIKNQGIYLLTESAKVEERLGGKTALNIKLSDTRKHGIVNGGHTYAAIREAVDTANPEELEDLKRAYVRLHVFENVKEDMVSEMAEGLNRSKQVDDPSLANLQGEFDVIKKILKGTPAADAISYRQGDHGEVYISEILAYLEMFNQHRFNDNKHPNNLYSKISLALKYFSEDFKTDKNEINALIQKLPEILKLSDMIKKSTPQAAKNNHFQFGRVKLGLQERAGGKSSKGMYLPFTHDTMPYRVPNGWVFPMLAAFRANLRSDGETMIWRLPLEQLLPEVIDDLVGVCVNEHKYNNGRPEFIGKKESTYSQCYSKVQLYLAKKNLLG